MDSDRTDPKPRQPNNDPPEDAGEELLPNSAADDFFGKMNHDFRRPKPSEEAVAAALHAIQTLASDPAIDHGAVDPATDDCSAQDSPTRDSAEQCPKCKAVNSASNRFCGYCGASFARREKPAAQITSAPAPLVQDQHVHHHHYHHHYLPESMSIDKHPEIGEARAALTGELALAQPLAPTAAADLQKLVRDWTLCFNSNRLDDLLALYSRDAIVLRPNVAAAHGRAAIRQLLQAALESGLGDVELTCADTGVLGDLACLTGPSRMLVPTAPGKRLEETGKFLMVARREGGEWKILADSWCMDSAPKEPSPTAPAPAERTPRSK